MIFPDLRSTGRSDPCDPARWNVGDFAQDMRAFCDALEIEKPIVLGHSYGGYVAIAYAARYPEHPSRLILSGTETRPHREASLELFRRLGGSRAYKAAKGFFATPDLKAGAAYARPWPAAVQPQAGGSQEAAPHAGQRRDDDAPARG